MTLRSAIDWKRFSLRSLLVLMSICCLLLGAWSVYVNPYRLQANSLKVVQRLGGEFESSPAAGPTWHRWIVSTFLGPEAFAQVTRVDLSHKKVTDDELRSLAGLVHLDELNLDSTSITDPGIAALTPMKNLRRLSLRHTNVSDKSANTLGTLRQLDTLYLTGTHFSDTAIDDLAKLTALKEIYVRWTGITNDGAILLRQKLPNCAVYYYPLVADAK